MQRFLLEYRFGMQEIETKVAILRDEFSYMHDYNPIEHVSSRVKSPDSLVDKVVRKGVEPDFASIRREITDIAGVRITCSFTTDAYRLFDLLTAQDDVTVVAVKDYIAAPKANGYKSLHAIVEVPVFPRPGGSRCRSRCSSARSRWTSGQASSTRSTTSTTARFRGSCWTSLKDAADTASELDEAHAATASRAARPARTHGRRLTASPDRMGG